MQFIGEGDDAFGPIWWMTRSGIANSAPTASWTSNAASGGRTITFTDTSTDPQGPIAAWLWDFGDSSTSTSQNPTHTYAASGNYTVTLTVTDQGGLTHQSSAQITVTARTITPSLLTENSNTTDATSWATASITPTANAVLYAFLVSTRAGGSMASPTASGNGLTWVNEEEVTLAGVRKLTVFRAQGASPSAGAVTFDFGGQTQDSVIWAVYEVPSVDTTGTNGSGATRQSVPQTNAAGTGFTNTLAALSDTHNVNLSAIMTRDVSGVIAPGANFSELSERNVATTGARLEIAWATNQTAWAPTWSVSDTSVQISLEVKAG